MCSKAIALLLLLCTTLPLKQTSFVLMMTRSSPASTGNKSHPVRCNILLTSNQPNNGAITLDTKGRVWSYHYVIHQKPLQSKIQNPGRFLLRRKPPEPSAPKSKIQNPYLESKFFLIQAMVVLKVARRDQRAIQKKMSL